MQCGRLRKFRTRDHRTSSGSTWSYAAFERHCWACRRNLKGIREVFPCSNGLGRAGRRYHCTWPPLPPLFAIKPEFGMPAQGNKTFTSELKPSISVGPPGSTLKTGRPPDQYAPMLRPVRVLAHSEGSGPRRKCCLLTDLLTGFRELRAAFCGAAAGVVAPSWSVPPRRASSTGKEQPRMPNTIRSSCSQAVVTGGMNT